MPKVDVFDTEKKKVGELELDDAVFGVEVKPHLLHELVRSHLASCRAGTHYAKERAAVRGSTRKLFRQKGTGRARRGARRAPGLRGSGRTKGPVTRDHSFRPPRKVRQAAMRSALSLFQKEGRLVVLDQFQLAEPKTKRVVEVLERFEAQRSVICDQATNASLRRASRNLPTVTFLSPEGLNVYELLKADRLLVTRECVSALAQALKPAVRKPAVRKPAAAKPAAAKPGKEG